MEYATTAADGVAKAATSTVAPSDTPSRRGAKSFEAVAQAIAQPTAGHRELQLQLHAAHRLGRVALARGWQAWVDCHLETLDRRLAALDAHIDAAAIAAEEDAWARAEFGLDA